MLLALLLSLAAGAHAGGKLVPVPVTESSRPIDALREAVYKTKKSKPTRKLARAIAALAEGKHSLARKLAGELATDPTLSDHSYYVSSEAFREEAEAKLKAGKPPEARELARKAISVALQIEQAQAYSPLIRRIPVLLARAELVLADSFVAQKRWASAQGHYEKAFKRLSDAGAYSVIRPHSLESYGKSCARNPAMLCQSWLWKLAGVFPRNSQELKALARAAPEISDRVRAPSNSSRQTQSYRTTVDPDLVAFDEAWALYLKGKHGDAAQAIEELLEKYPRSTARIRARYWLGAALSKDGETEKSRKVFEQVVKDAPLTYHGLLASLGLGKGLQSYFTAAVPVGLASDPFLSPTELFKLKRAERFLAEGLQESAAIELREFRPRSPHANPFLLYLAMLNSEAGNHNGAFIVLQELIHRGYDGVYTTAGLKMIFPVAHQKAIEKAAAQFKLDPVLLISLMKQESAFDSKAASGVGAHGLMQLMPATASDIDNGIHRADLTDSEISIRLGSRYLKSLIDRYNGNLVFALAAYNAGPGAVNRWVRAGLAKQGMLEFIEQIPYKETREYVGSIIRNYFWYAPRFKAEVPKGVEFFWPATPAPAPAPASAEEETPEASAPKEEEE